MSLGRGDSVNPFFPMVGDRYDAPAIRGRQVYARLLAHSPKFTDVSVVAAWNGSLEIAAKRLLYFGDMPQPARVLHGQGNNTAVSNLGIALGACGHRSHWIYAVRGPFGASRENRAVSSTGSRTLTGSHVNESDRAAKYAT